MSGKQRVEVPVSLIETVTRLAESAYPHECCAVLVGFDDGRRRQVREVIPALNERSDSPENRFLISAEVVRRVEESLNGQEAGIVGFFHSHPDAPAMPSEFDRRHAWPWYSYWIMSVRQGRGRDIRGWRLAEDRSRFIEEEIRKGSAHG